MVSGLVETHPISEDQRRSEWAVEACSLEKDFPSIHRALLEHATVLIRDREMFHQEIEFTFESDDPSDLYILQTRDRVMAAITSVSTFVPSESLEHARLATGIGAGGGALSGRLAYTAEDVEQLRLRDPSDPIILVRPDAVPDDIPLLLRADGMVTSLGGATSHAALWRSSSAGPAWWAVVSSWSTSSGGARRSADVRFGPATSSRSAASTGRSTWVGTPARRCTGAGWSERWPRVEAAHRCPGERSGRERSRETR